MSDPAENSAHAKESGGPDPDSTPGTPQETAPNQEPVTKPEADPAPVERPDWLPEGFADGAALAKSYGELRSRFGQKNEALKADLIKELRASAPETADGYAFEIDPALVPEGLEVKPPADDDPMLKAARTVLHRLGASPDDFKELAGAFVSWQIGTMPNFHAEKAKLGEGADARVAQVDAWLSRSLSETHYKAMMGTVTTAAAVEAIEALMRRAAPSGGFTAPAGATAQGGITPAEAAALASHPDYNDPVKGAEMRGKFSAFIQGGGRLPGMAPRR